MRHTTMTLPNTRQLRVQPQHVDWVVLGECEVDESVGEEEEEL
jgi:hypothetical protein